MSAGRKDDRPRGEDDEHLYRHRDRYERDHDQRDPGDDQRRIPGTRDGLRTPEPPAGASGAPPGPRRPAR